MQTVPSIQKVLNAGATGCSTTSGTTFRERWPARTPKRPLPVSNWTETDKFPVSIQTVSKRGLSLSF